MPYTNLGLPFARDSHTSYKAAESIDVKTRGEKAQRYLRIIASGPATDHEMAAAIRVPLSSINSIRNGLMQAGLVEKRAEIKAGPYGKDCATWGLTAAGYAAVAQLERG